MKFLTEYMTFKTKSRRAFVNITPDVEKLIKKSGIKEGLCLVNAMHITASVFINDNESGLHHDYEKWLEELAPHEPIKQYRHNDTGEDNADAHLKRQVMGREVVVAITDGQLDFGPWETIYFTFTEDAKKGLTLVAGQLEGVNSDNESEIDGLIGSTYREALVESFNDRVLLDAPRYLEKVAYVGQRLNVPDGEYGSGQGSYWAGFIDERDGLICL